MLSDRKPSRIFYGWWVVGACLVISLYSSGATVHSFTALFEPIANEFGWSYAQVSFAASLRGAEMGLFAPLLGLLVDRWGPRRLMFGGVILGGIGLVLLSRITSLSMFYLSFILISVSTSTCSGTVVMTAVSNWFRRKLLRALGIMAIGVALGGLLVPLVSMLIDVFGWRTAMVSLGLGMWIIGLPLSLIVRHKPEQYGYMLDGELSSSVVVDKSLASTTNTEVDIGVKQALTSRTFWHIALALMYVPLSLMAVITHVMPYLSSIGIARSVSSLLASAMPLASIGGRLGVGWLGDKFEKRRVAAVSLALIALGLLCFGYVPTAGMWLLVPFTILVGIGWGSSVPLRVALVQECFGRVRLGTILGFIFGVTALGQMVGPPLAGWTFDRWGSYQGIWLAFAGLGIAATITMLTTPKIDNATTSTPWA
ncbi:MFS transporter [Chloroflexota bacterium]